eukprot:CAMPEP_0117426462 /NCGR_PEP_ID=MMETSP0758-20121206/6571_1 /TAXON_ID=63605 /ORGANISM="Percolomonas cosmopolitus, Strain AE-1 (ATCC 50343)" /LENGTH=355 /DNA_ID=CAMNT_0005211645 /DNA_START=17 /DNA_END=1081 /DNA_ORIENTATION=+
MVKPEEENEYEQDEIIGYDEVEEENKKGNQKREQDQEATMMAASSTTSNQPSFLQEPNATVPYAYRTPEQISPRREDTRFGRPSIPAGRRLSVARHASRFQTWQDPSPMKRRKSSIFRERELYASALPIQRLNKDIKEGNHDEDSENSFLKLMKTLAIILIIFVVVFFIIMMLQSSPHTAIEEPHTETLTPPETEAPKPPQEENPPPPPPRYPGNMMKSIGNRGRLVNQLPFCTSDPINGISAMEEDQKTLVWYDTMLKSTCRRCPNEAFCIEGEIADCEHERAIIQGETFCLPKGATMTHRQQLKDIRLRIQRMEHQQEQALVHPQLIKMYPQLGVRVHGKTMQLVEATANEAV